MLDINNLSKEVFTWAKSVGWWDDMNRCPFQTLQLFSTEVAEATEGERKNLMDDKLPHRPMGEVELADVVIRAVDMGGRYNWLYDVRSLPVTFDYGTETIGAMHLYLNRLIVEFADLCLGENTSKFIEDNPRLFTHVYTDLINACYQIAEKQGYDLDGAIVEKLEFNRTRADHKRENRAKENGKEF